MSLLLGPAFGRLLPCPCFSPGRGKPTFAAGLLFPLAGMVADIRRSGAVHPAWRWGVAAMIGALRADRSDHLQPRSARPSITRSPQVRPVPPSAARVRLTSRRSANHRSLNTKGGATARQLPSHLWQLTRCGRVCSGGM